MGTYEPLGYFSFEGTSSEQRMMENLIDLMDLEEPDRGWELPCEFDVDWPLAILGYVEKRNQPGVYSREYDDLAIVPKMFAALFPASEFDYSLTAWYSVTNDDTPFIKALYKDNKLLIKEGYYYNEEDIEKICRSIMEEDPDVKAEYEEMLDEDDLSWFEMFDELVDDQEERMESLYEYREVLPSRDTEYEKTFLKDCDLLVYLVSEEVKNHDMALAEYIKAFSFTKQQFQDFIKIATECKFVEMSEFLLEEQQRRFSDTECNPSGNAPKKSKCEGLTFVITGKVYSFKNRDEFVEYVERRKGHVSGSVSKKTDYLVNNDSESKSSKNKKAKELGIPIITEAEFLSRFGDID